MGVGRGGGACLHLSTCGCRNILDMPCYLQLTWAVAGFGSWWGQVRVDAKGKGKVGQAHVCTWLQVSGHVIFKIHTSF